MPVISSLPGTVEPFTLTSNEMSVAGFTYAGNISVTTPSGSALAMRFTMTQAVIAALSLYSPCTNHTQWIPVVPTSATASQELTIDALELRATVNGQSVDWTAVATATTTVPPAEPLAGGAGTIAGPITATIVHLSAGKLSMPNVSGSARSC